jgi:hypothetical protein
MARDGKIGERAAIGVVAVLTSKWRYFGNSP